VLVDPPLTNAQIGPRSPKGGRAPETPGVRLHHHGHPDHWFGTATLLERFGDAESVGTPPEAPSGRCASNCRAKEEGFARPSPGPGEHPGPRRPGAGQDSSWRSSPPGRERVTRHRDSSVLHVPSSPRRRGDVVYNGVHQMMLEAWRAFSVLRASTGRRSRPAPRGRRPQEQKPAAPRRPGRDPQYCVTRSGSWPAAEAAGVLREMVKLHGDRLTGATVVQRAGLLG